ncbi:TetR family transcriptional regulator [Novosphingobium sp. HII-3]|uniref:TetR family transcriptional regulator n=1 Tax=Novosphingobium sp. HII-3 TaxID=2075565 RepID=UPI001E4CD4DF|nr:TetR family transcriptional regulator [Novosphingobium sp. HII-3]
MKKPNGAASVTRKQLLSAAGELMATRGSTDISLNDIAEKSGLSSALVKYYFGNKAGMMLGLLREVLAPSLLQLRHLPAMELPPQTKLRIHISGLVKSYYLHPYVNRLMHQLLYEDSETFGPILAEEFSRPVADVQKMILEEGTRLGVFRPVDPLFFYLHIIGACDQLFHGRAQLEHLFGVKTIDDDVRRGFIDHLYGVVMSGIAAPVSSS